MCLAAAVYAEQLLPRGHGYPLWIPEPDTTDNQVRIGDVGYIWEGSFCTLFNATLPASHPVNRNGVPKGFVPLEFDTAELVRTRDTYLPDAPVCSQYVRCLTAVAQAGTRFVCYSLRGLNIFLTRRLVSQLVHSTCRWSNAPLFRMCT